MKVLYLVPDLFGLPGGIARYCRLVSRVLCESPLITGLDVVALWDQPGTCVDARYLFGEKFTYTAAGGNQLAFVTAALGSRARRNYDVMLSGHVAFTPLLFGGGRKRAPARRITFIYGTDAWYRLPMHKRWALQASDLVIAISRFTADRAAAANGLAPGKLRVLHNCLDPVLEMANPGPADPAWPRHPGSPGRVLVTVSRLSKSAWGKGHSAVLRALPGVVKHVPEVKYVIVGEGDLQPDLETLAVELGIRHRTQFLGGLSDDEVRQVMNTSELFVMPSRDEGFGFVYLEAMALGLPIVGGACDASAEVLGDAAGVVVDPDDIPQLTLTVVELLSDSQRWRQLAQGGRRRLDMMFRYPRFKASLLAYLT